MVHRLEMPLWMNAGAPMPHVLANGDTVFVVFFESEARPDGKPPDEARASAYEREELLAWVRFDRVNSVKFGWPNEDVLRGHPLFERGLRLPYNMYAVEDSPWIDEIRGQNRIHPFHRDEPFDALSHYIIVFHDETLECLARSHVFGTMTRPLREGCGELLVELFGGPQQRPVDMPPADPNV